MPLTSFVSDPSSPKKRQRLRTARRRTMRPHERPFREWDQSRLARNLIGIKDSIVLNTATRATKQQPN